LRAAYGAPIHIQARPLRPRLNRGYADSLSKRVGSEARCAGWRPA